MKRLANQSIYHKKLLTANPTTAINVNPKEIPVINGIGMNDFFDIRFRIVLKIAAGRLISTSTEIAKCQS